MFARRCHVQIVRQFFDGIEHPIAARYFYALEFIDVFESLRFLQSLCLLKQPSPHDFVYTRLSIVPQTRITPHEHVHEQRAYVPRPTGFPPLDAINERTSDLIPEPLYEILVLQVSPEEWVQFRFGKDGEDLDVCCEEFGLVLQAGSS